MTVAMGPGVLFGGYRIEAVVGRGGMGVVYRATDLSLARPVALKLIAPEFSQDPGFRERFLREPRLAASLDHPGLVPIYEAGEREGQLYLAMRWVEGSDLRQMLQRGGRLSPEVTVNVLTQIAAALDATHRRGVVHRDVKPANILVDDDGHAYLGDFGVSGEAGAGGRMAGTLDYLAPEQIRGEDLDGRTDCFALGCVLHECLSGAPPFRRETESEALWAHLREPPPRLRDYPELDPVIARALAKERDERYPDCEEMMRAAAAALGVAGPAPGRRLSGATLLVLGGSLLLAAASAAALVSALGGDSSVPRSAALDVGDQFGGGRRHAGHGRRAGGAAPRPAHGRGPLGRHGVGVDGGLHFGDRRQRPHELDHAHRAPPGEGRRGGGGGRIRLGCRRRTRCGVAHPAGL